MEENIQAEEQQHLFDSHVQYTEASQGSRFLNFLIDNLFMRFVLSYATGYAFGYLLLAIAPDFLMSLAYEERGWRYFLLTLLLGYFNYVIYYTFCEAAFKGYTLGKLITGTKAIRNDGEPLTFKDVLLRSLSRIVPFEVFSGLGQRPWHDTWTKTTVVKAR
jgi:uncharacterized RDD family membrane protein YckC